MNRILSLPRHCRAHGPRFDDSDAGDARPGGHVVVDAIWPSPHTTTFSTPALRGPGPPRPFVLNPTAFEAAWQLPYPRAGPPKIGMQGPMDTTGELAALP